MSNKDKPHRFDPQRWKQQQLETMTNAAMRRKDAEFVAAHRDDTDEQLIAYLRQCAQELGHFADGPGRWMPLGCPTQHIRSAIRADASTAKP